MTVFNTRPRTWAQRGFTIVELLVVLVIMSIALVLGAVALGGLAGAKTKEGTGKLSTAIRYTYNLAAINNKVYALYLNLDENSYHAAPLKTDNDCDRVLLAIDGKDTGAVLVRFSDVGNEDDDEDEESGSFNPAMSAAKGDSSEVGPPAWANDEGSKSNKLIKMLSQDVRTEARAQSEQVGAIIPTAEDVDGERKKKRLKSYQRNLMGKTQKLPNQVRFAGVVLREGEEAVTSGVVPIVFFPHGYTQRALIYVEGGDTDNPEEYTIEVMSLQGRGVIHAERLELDAFEEIMD